MLKSEFYLKYEEAKNNEFLYMGLIIYNEDTNFPELIVNFDTEVDYKVDYICRVYDERLRLKTCNKIYIADVVFDSDLTEIRKVYNRHYHEVVKKIVNSNG